MAVLALIYVVKSVASTYIGGLRLVPPMFVEASTGSGEVGLLTTDLLATFSFLLRGAVDWSSFDNHCLGGLFGDLMEAEDILLHFR
jgi:hypothetical protein